MKIWAEAERKDRFHPRIGNLRGCRPLFSILLAIWLVAAATTTLAQQPLTLSGSPLKGEGDLKAQGLIISMESRTPPPTPGSPGKAPASPAKTSGTSSPASASTFLTDRSQVQKGAYYIRVTLKPHIEAPGDGSMQVLLDQTRVTKQILQGQEEGKLLPATGNVPSTDMEDPARYIQEVRALFDQGTATATGTGDAPRVIQIPQGATQFQGLEVDFVWKNNKKTFKFKPPAPPAGHRLRWIVLGVGVVCVVGVIAFLLLRRRSSPGGAIG